MATDTQIERINEISKLARTAWFTLLAYLVFVGITLLGVEDADFFVPSRQTQLPLVNVQIPTASFFWAAPLLGAALYIYLHLFVLKLWDAIRDAPDTVPADPEDPASEAQVPLSERIHPWIFNDLAAFLKGREAHRPRPLRWLSNGVTIALVWIGGPLVTGAAWWRSFPAHDLWLSGVIGACFLISLICGFTTAATIYQTRKETQSDHARWGGTQIANALSIIALLVILGLTLVRTTFDARFEIVISGEEKLAFNTLQPANLENEQLVPLPPEWRNYQVARMAFRETWCKREGLSMQICDHRNGNDRTQPPHVAEARTDYCTEHGIETDAACDQTFADLDTRFDDAWQTERDSINEALPALDLTKKDLRRMNASGASLVGAVFREARMEGANLWGALMEGADLERAQMEGANLRAAQMEGANLEAAQMEGADLAWAQMEGADLSFAHMEGANLSRAEMEGTKPRWAQMKGADLRNAQMEGADFMGAQMEGAILIGANLKSADWTRANVRSPAQSADFRGGQRILQKQFDQMIGDTETLLPDFPEPVSGEPYYIPSCWPESPSILEDFLSNLPENVFVFLTAEDARSEFLCRSGQEPQRTGTPCALDLTREECLDPMVNPNHPANR
ncbi:MAG: pentapeptide repeat-containing protein [Pseudomonadota bacterium]